MNTHRRRSDQQVRPIFANTLVGATLLAAALVLLGGTASWLVASHASADVLSTVSVTILPDQNLLSIRQGAVGANTTVKNPFGSQGETVIAGLLANSLQDGELQTPSSGPSIVVTKTDLRETSYFSVTMTGSSVSSVVAARRDLLTRMEGYVRQMQLSAGSPTTELYAPSFGGATSAPDVSYPSKSRLFSGGALLSVILGFFLFSFLRRVKQAYPETISLRS